MLEKSLHEIELAAWSERASHYDASFASISSQVIDALLDSFNPLAGKRHLDVACDTGHLVAAAAKRGAISEGCDFAQTMIDVARMTYPNARFQVADASQLPYGDGSMDVVTCTFGLSHMENPQAAVNEAFRVLKSGGTFAFTLWFGPEDGGEAFVIVKNALAAYATADIALPEKWTQLRLADEAACKAITQQGGFGIPIFKRLPVLWRTSAAQDVVNIFDKVSIRTRLIIDRQPPAVQRQIYEHILAEAEARRTNGVISLSWPALLTIVQKPKLGAVKGC